MTAHDSTPKRQSQTDPACVDGVEQLKAVLERHIDERGWRHRLPPPAEPDPDQHDQPTRGRRRG